MCVRVCICVYNIGKMNKKETIGNMKREQKVILEIKSN